MWLRPSIGDYIIYTDSAPERPRSCMGAAALGPEFNRIDGSIRASRAARPYDPAQIGRIVSLLSGSPQISGLELAAVIISIPQLRYFLTNRTVTIVDNVAVLGSLAKGTSKVLAARRSISTFRRAVSMF